MVIIIIIIIIIIYVGLLLSKLQEYGNVWLLLMYT